MHLHLYHYLFQYLYLLHLYLYLHVHLDLYLYEDLHEDLDLDLDLEARMYPICCPYATTCSCEAPSVGSALILPLSLLLRTFSTLSVTHLGIVHAHAREL